MKLLAVAVVLLVAAPAYGQSTARPPQGWSLGVHGGGAAFTDFQRSTVRAPVAAAGGTLIDRELPRRVSAKTAGALGGSISYWSKEWWGVRLFASFAPSRFETLIPESDAEMLDMPRSSEDAEELAPLSIISTDAQLMVRLPTIGNRLMPYTFAGIGIVRYSTTESDAPMPEEADEDFASGSQIKPAGRLGIGAAFPLGRDGWRLNFELSDQIAPTPLRRGGDRSVTVTNAVAFMIGVSFEL